MTEEYTEFLQIGIGQQHQRVEVNAVVVEYGSVLRQSKRL